MSSKSYLHLLFVLCACFGVWLVPRCAVAEQPPGPGQLEYQPPAWPDVPSTGAMLLRLAFGTVIVLALSVATLWIARRRLRGASVARSGGSQLRFVDALKLDNRCSVHLIEAGNQQVLVGLDGSGLKTLVPLPEPFQSTLGEAERSEPIGAEAEAVQSGPVA